MDKRTVTVSTGDNCTMSRSDGQFITQSYNGSLSVFPSKSSLWFQNILAVEDNAAGPSRNLPVNTGIADLSNLTTYWYRKSSDTANQPNIFAPHAQQLVDEYNAQVAPKTGTPARMLDHSDILKGVGIECFRNGVSVAPVLSTDDIRAMARASGVPIDRTR
jgi:hypothetical protein